MEWFDYWYKVWFRITIGVICGTAMIGNGRPEDYAVAALYFTVFAVVAGPVYDVLAELIASIERIMRQHIERTNRRWR